jgi:outer membrane protein assembly factor BamE (lipoprotein component of BamABCDE complex)
MLPQTKLFIFMKPIASIYAESIRRFRLLSVTAIALVGGALAGCVFSTNDTTRVTGQQVSADQLAQVKPGVTKDSVLALLGSPSNTIDLGGGMDVWEYKYTQNQNKSADFIFLFSSDKSTHVEQTTSVEFKDGVVVKTWTK